MPKVSTPILLDAPSLVSRCAFASATQELKVGGELTGGLYTSVRSLAGAVKRMSHLPRLGPVIACYDRGRHPLRSRLFPDYKANRTASSRGMTEGQLDQVRAQKRRSRSFLASLGCRIVTVQDREADDCIAQLTHICNERGIMPVVISGDRDMWQLLGEAHVWDLNASEFVTPKILTKKFGVPPEHFVYYKALLGDHSDNLPGIPGVGPKTVATFLAEHSDNLRTVGSPSKAIRAWLTSLADAEFSNKRHALIPPAVDHAVRVCRAVSLRSPGFEGEVMEQLAERASRPREFDRGRFERLCRKWRFMSLLADVDITPMFETLSARKFTV